MRVVAQVESAAFVDPEEVPVRVDDERETRLAFDGRIGRLAIGLHQDRRNGGDDDPRRSALTPVMSVMRFCSARLAVTRASETVIGPVGRSLPVSNESAVSSVRSSPEKLSSVTEMSLMTISPASSS